ncbi:SpoIIE family protein phosphatase [Chrysiogenes arsenatis]|uniref:SpoIIE family protein phosphatase n=1 Tax=Chrysiogenes arsenatis TaxID=309797 RepID=UPI0003F82A59|nr:SpoIIE family protein phosphatase [Chrysiogenes arsenatis]
MKSATRIRRQSILVVFLLLVLTGVVSIALFGNLTHDIATKMGTDLTRRHVLWHKERLSGAIGRELALTQKLADSAFLRRWSADEHDPTVKSHALEELNSFARLFEWGSWFVAFSGSNSYYFNNAQGERDAREFVETLNPDHPKDIWFFTSLKLPQTYSFNVDINPTLGITNLWINTVIADGEQRIGLTGTGLDLSEFIHGLVNSQEDDITSFIINRDGAIVAHKDRSLINMNLHSQARDEWTTIYSLLERPEDEKTVARALQQVVDTPDEIASIIIAYNNASHVAAIGYLPELDWMTVSLVNLGTVSGLRQIAPIGITLGAIFIVMVLALLFLLDRYILLPIGNVARGAASMSQGNYSVRLAEQREDEIGELVQAFNRLADTVEGHTTTLEKRVEERTAALQEANSQIVQGIEYAQTLLHALLPNQQTLQKHLPQSFLLWEPRDGVGGDFMYLRRDGDRMLLGLADCTGHGVAGALMAMSAHAILDSLVAERGVGAPGALLGEFNRRLKRALHTEQAATRLDNGLEMVLCLIDTAEKQLSFASGNLALYMVKDKSCTVLAGTRRSLGYRRSAAAWEFPDVTCPYDPEATYYLSSDGYLDQIGGVKQISYGSRRFAATLSQLAHHPLSEQNTHLQKHLREYRRGTAQRDDITVVGFRLIPSAYSLHEATKEPV